MHTQHVQALVSSLNMSLRPPFHCQGMDISKAMLDVAAEREVEGDLCLHDLVRGWLWGCSSRPPPHSV